MRVPLTALILVPLAVAADPLLYKTLDGGQTWQVVLSGLAPPSSLVAPVAAGPANSQIYLLDPGIGKDSLYSSTNSGAQWNQGPPVALSGAIASMLADPGAPQTLYLSGAIAPVYTGGCLGPCITPGKPVAYKSTDGGGSWVSLAPIQGDGTVPAVLALDRQTPGRLLAGTNAGLFISTDYGGTWGSGALSGAIYCLSFDPQNATTVFAGTANGVMKSTDSGATWVAASNGLSQGIAAIAFDSNQSGVLYAATLLQDPTKSGVYFSHDGGANWTRGVLPSPYRYVKTLLPDPVVASRVWAASDLGVLLSNDSGATWASVANWPAGAFPSLAADSSGAIYASAGNPLPQVHIDSAGSAASYAIALAPGELASVFGASLATGNASAGSPPLPTALSGTLVRVNGGSAPLLYGSPGQFNFQVPFEISPGVTQLSVVSAGGSAAVPILVVPAAPAIFTLNMQGTGPGAIEHGLTYQLVTDTNPAAGGEVISVYCTGLGAVVPPVRTGAAATSASQTVVPVQVVIAGNAAQVLYSGVAPGFAGLNQVNVVVPPGTPSGPQPLVISANGIASNTVTVSIR